jgi:hypothetical protein
LVFKGVAALQPLHAKAQIEDIENIEAVFAAFEMAKLLGRLGSLSTDEIDKLPAAMKNLITKTLEMTIGFPSSADEFPSPPEPYNHLLELIKPIVQTGFSSDINKVSFITFNYDVCLDYALSFLGIPIDYCLDENTSNSGIRLLKLHGSLNWGLCPHCEKVVHWSIKKYLEHSTFELVGNTEKNLRLEIGSRISGYKHESCSYQLQEPMIIPPTWSKAQYHEQIEFVWRAAAVELTNAENIFVSGYSLPPTDHFFRYLYALGTIGEARLKNFWVFDPDRNVEDRFKNLLGPLAHNRFNFYPETFNIAIRIILGSKYYQEIIIPKPTV